MTEVLHIQGLTRRYGSTLAVAGIDLSVGPGEIVGLVGPNGAGKTTTMRMLATLLVPSAGDAWVAGHSIRRAPDRVRRVIGYMPDSFGVYDGMRAWEYLDFFARCHSIPGRVRARLVHDLLDLVDLGHKRDAEVQSLSRGMQQRLCLAQTLVHDPPLLVLDEPASGLDPRARVELRELIRELRAMGKTVLISSHILPELEELCTRVAIIDHGRVLAEGTVADIERRLRRGAVFRVSVAGDTAAVEAAALALGRDPAVRTSETLPDGRIEIGVPEPDTDLPGILARLVAAGHPVSAFAPAVSDLEELFLQVTARRDEADGGDADMTHGTAA
ncbi:MAG: ABC transporter ATP-binding protein [Chloroflexi bacterium]|nr:ABC transporter ATP-binding protein [Chloroflexota bacterium]